MIQAFYPKNETHCLLFLDNTYGGVTMQALVRKRNEEIR